MRVFSDPYFPAQEQILQFCPYAGKYGSDKTFVLGYFTLCNIVSENVAFHVLEIWESFSSPISGRQSASENRFCAGVMLEWGTLSTLPKPSIFLSLNTFCFIHWIHWQNIQNVNKTNCCSNSLKTYCYIFSTYFEKLRQWAHRITLK